MATAGTGLTDLLRLQPGLSLAWVNENSALTGEIAERFLEGLRKAGMPEGRCG
jgi:hypothetical protein